MESNAARYYVLDSEHEHMMLLFDPPNPGFRDRWFGGKPFAKHPGLPVVARIKPNHEHGTLLDYFGTACLMSERFFVALRDAGVDNLDVYDAVIRSKDDSIEHKGYKAFNLIGLVRAADLQKTTFTPEVAARTIDASIESLEIDPEKTKGLLMFRLAEYVGAVIVHEKVRNVLEKHGFPNIVFREPSSYIS